MAGDRGHRSSARPKPVTPLTLGEAPGADSTLIAVPPGPRFRDNFTRASREDSVPKQRVRIAGAVLTHGSRITWLAKAHMMLKSRPHHQTIEIWLGNSLAYRARQDRAAA